ncbi:hypothetical protein C8F01DRAFT_1252223 [Mycena amicta]|nr:hypothetical protein C8F01DRAFT_1252223 [Mycena amicta]
MAASRPPSPASPGARQHTAIDVDALPSPLPSNSPGRTVAKAIDVDEVRAGYTPPARQRTRLSCALTSAPVEEEVDSSDESDSDTSLPYLPPLTSAPMEEDADSSDDSNASLPSLPPADFNPQPERSIDQEHEASAPRLANTIHVAAEAEQADHETTAAELRAAREQRTELANIRTVLAWSAQQRAQQGREFEWREATAYLTAACPPESPRDELVDPDLACTICAEVLSHPVITSCQHVFCFVCLRGNMEISVNCPICRKVQNVAPAASAAFTRVHTAAVQMCYPGWNNLSEVRINFVNLALQGYHFREPEQRFLLDVLRLPVIVRKTGRSCRPRPENGWLAYGRRRLHRLHRWRMRRSNAKRHENGAVRIASDLSHGAQIALRKRTARELQFLQLHGIEAFAERQATRNIRRYQVEDDEQLGALDKAYREDLRRRRAHRADADAAKSLQHLRTHVL